MNTHPASLLVQLGIPGLALLVAALFVLAARASARAERSPVATTSTRLGTRSATLRAAAYVTALLAITGAIAACGLLSDVTRRPPLFPPLMIAVVTGTLLVARSRLGRQIAANMPLWALVGAQGFRLPLELVMRQAARDGVMPVQMSFEGYNFDVVTGTTALALGVALYFGRAPGALALLWNVLGTVLLAVIVGIAGASLPFVAAFGQDRVNDFVLSFPYVWLPTVLVPFALFGHVTIFRRLLSARRRERPNERRGEAPARASLPPTGESLAK